MSRLASFVVATPSHCGFDEDKARVLATHGLLHFVAKGTRRGTEGVSPSLTRLNPRIGLVYTAAAMTLSTFKGESVRFRLNPWFDNWVKRQLKPGDHIISSYGYANESFKWVRQNGGKAILSAGNSHPENFWTILVEEHRRWKCSNPPIDRKHYERSIAMMSEVDYVFSPSTFVTNSFLSRGFKPEQILRDIYAVNMTHFKPPTGPRDKNRPLTVISTGALSLRKGAPYMLEAFRLVLKKHPSARLRLTRQIDDSAIPVLAKYADLPIDWAPGLPHPQLAERLQGSDIFVLASLEDGYARTVTEGLACGLPVITTPNTGASDVIIPGKNGEIVPIRDPVAIAEAILKWADLILSRDGKPEISFDANSLSFETFAKTFMEQLKSRGLA
jgi:glycosyltransferase involved in cell wall biosynthesis